MEKAPAVCTGESAKRRLRSAQTAKGRLRFQGAGSACPVKSPVPTELEPEHVSSQENRYSRPEVGGERLY